MILLVAFGCAWAILETNFVANVLLQTRADLKEVERKLLAQMKEDHLEAMAMINAIRRKYAPDS